MTSFQRSDVEILDLKTVFQGYFRVDRYRLRHRHFDGQWSEPMVREVFERGHAVAVLPYDPQTDRVVLIEQFRCGAYAAGYDNPWLIECIAGIIDDGEDKATVARRESLEETGFTANELILAGDFIATPGGSSETCRLYCALGDLSNIGGTHGLADEHEDIRAFTLSREEAYNWCKDGRINNAMAVLAVQWLMLNYTSLRSSI